MGGADAGGEDAGEKEEGVKDECARMKSRMGRTLKPKRGEYYYTITNSTTTTKYSN